ncbi:MAG: hypothetical protein U5K79_15480 [Cyclobacteriaceae bacterium]|nr:hypothetical protein [Cyclobacteriaceae bacterium]
MDDILKKTRAGVLVNGFNETAYDNAVTSFLSLQFTGESIRQHAVKYFSLEQGVAAYDQIYRSI